MAFEPADHVGEHVTITGSAEIARAGAIVDLTDGTPIYVSGLEEWDPAVVGRVVEVSGVLRRRPSRTPATGDDGAHRHGLGETYALEDPTWTVIGTDDR